MQFNPDLNIASNLFCNTRLPTTERYDYLEEMAEFDSDSDSDEDEKTRTTATSDIDSITLLSHTYNNLIDSACPNKSTWTFCNTLYRTMADTGGRASLKFVDDDFPCPKFGGKRSGNPIPVTWCPNITLCQVNTDSGVTLHINYILLGSPHVRTNNYLTTLELTVRSIMLPGRITIWKKHVRF